MMTSARPMAISRSRAQTRISLRSVFAGEAASGVGAVEFAEAGTEEITGAGFSGGVEAPRCFRSERSILGALLFIAWASRPAPHAICFLRNNTPGAASIAFLMILAASAALLAARRGGHIVAGTSAAHVSKSRFLGRKRVIQRSKCRDHCCFRPEDQATERGLAKTMPEGGFEFRVSPTAFRPNRESSRSNLPAFLQGLALYRWLYAPIL